MCPTNGTQTARRNSYSARFLQAGSSSVKLLAALLVIAPLVPSSAYASKTTDIVRDAQHKTVKIYGAGGLRQLESYQSGFLISADGYVLTVFSHVLDSDTITITLDDGRRLEGKLIGADPRLEIAVLKVDTADLPHFDLQQALPGVEGTRVLAFSNVFGVATGDEPVSVLHGSIVAVTTLTARRGAYETAYKGTVYVLDAMTNNPGAAGGALTDSQGKLLGLLGKQLRNSRNNIWLNYALPANELLPAIEAIESGQARTVASRPATAPNKGLTLADLGLVLVPNVLERTPPFIDSVRADSRATQAGIRTDDLVVFVDDQLIQSCNALVTELRRLDPDADVHFTLLRAGELIEVTLKASDK
ncbi:MAG TPA: S1C family serine protease [Pirellulales bacterium]|jgi:serine protease Do|nr:S1C family serine protease [Pirellulales bacterium]